MSKFIHWSLRSHLITSLTIRVALVAYGVFHDLHFEVPYTDVDYKVFTDAARHVVKGGSPYNASTFRYSPLIAFLLTPNIYFHPLFGKLLFCLMDLLVAYLIWKLVFYNVYVPKSKKRRKLAVYWAQVSMLLWLYNPLTVTISTRGNSDSLACFFVILSLYAIQVKWHPFLVGLLHGLCVHFRLYPIIYSLLYYMHYYSFKPKKLESKLVYVKPNHDQLMLVLGTLTSLSGLTGLFYLMYGYRFLYESLIYHFIRVDFKHNFSLYFYLQYLTAFIQFPTSLWQPLLINLPPIILFINFSIRYGLCKPALNFGALALTITFVIYNKVLTSQYFVWIMGLLPLCAWQIKLSSGTVFCMLVIWLLAQGCWLLPAYLLEFKGEDTFLHIWIQGVSLFCAHIAIFGKLIKHFTLPAGELKSIAD